MGVKYTQISSALPVLTPVRIRRIPVYACQFDTVKTQTKRRWKQLKTREDTLMQHIKTNKRFDKLTNLDIKTHYRDGEFYLSKSSFVGAFAYWTVVQSPYDIPTDKLLPALQGFLKYISPLFEEVLPEKFTFGRLQEIINEEAFEKIPEIESLNHAKIEMKGFMASSSRYHTTKPDYDYIDLGALTRNIFYMLLRECITQR